MRTAFKFQIEHFFQNLVLAFIIGADRLKRTFRRHPPRSFWDL